ncbi:hypothetical protein AAMO2058_001244300 [Amorphochlora amoebiformis]
MFRRILIFARTRFLRAEGVRLGMSTGAGAFVWAFQREAEGSPGNKMEEKALGAPGAKLTQIQRTRHGIVGRYENRIRQMSNPQKVFEYFATETDENGNPLMTPHDFVRSITPFGGRDSDLVGHLPPAPHSSPTIKPKLSPNDDMKAVPMIFRKLSPSGDGRLTINEYLLITTFLSLPASSFSIAFRMFDQNGDGFVDAKEFRSVLGMLYRHSPVSNSFRPQPKSWESMIPTPTEIFGEKYEKRLNPTKFAALLQEIREAVWMLQFNMFDENGDGTISAYALASHITSHAGQSQRERFEINKKKLDPTVNVEDSSDIICRMRRKRYVWQDFKSFHNIVDSVSQLEKGIQISAAADRPVTKSEFKRILKSVTGGTISKSTLDLMYYLFDENRDGTLDHKEFVDVMGEITAHGLNKHRDVGIQRLFACYTTCMKRGGPE